MITDPIEQALAALDHLNEAGAGPKCCVDARNTIARALEAYATIEQSARPKWILASAALPDSDVIVLVRGTDGDIVSAELEFTDDSEGHGKPYWISEGSNLALRDYPHWCPRPEDPPPTGASDG